MLQFPNEHPMLFSTDDRLQLTTHRLIFHSPTGISEMPLSTYAGHHWSSQGFFSRRYQLTVRFTNGEINIPVKRSERGSFGVFLEEMLGQVNLLRNAGMK